jgi:ABC-2 type transport system ATP-binding protein
VAAPVEAEGLVRTFGELRAVDGIDLVVQPGEIFGFLGPNGAGKSTTVRMLTTLLRPTDGVARVAGFDVVTQADEVRRSIGVALQDAAIDPLMTGNELMRLQATLHGIPRGDAKRRSGELLERVGLTAAGDRKVGEYSGGMRRRLDLAMSLIHHPSVLFLDEPTTGLDPTSRMTLWEEVRALNAEGTTVFLTTQYMEEDDQLAQRIAIIDQGVIVREGTPTKLKEAVGAPTLVLEIDPEHYDQARVMLCRQFGDERPTKPGWIALGLVGGAAEMTSVVRALDDLGAEVRHIELNAPSLDDVFADATGRRIEGADVEPGTAGDFLGDGEAVA